MTRFTGHGLSQQLLPQGRRGVVAELLQRGPTLGDYACSKATGSMGLRVEGHLCSPLPRAPGAQY